MKSIRTVQGDINKNAAGVVLPHEHFLIDLSPGLNDKTISESELQEDLRLDNHFRVSRFKRNKTECVLDDESLAIEEGRAFAAAGGQTFADVTSVGAGRSPEALVRIAEATGLNVVMGSGYYQHIYHPEGFSTRSVEDIADEIVSDIRQGVAGTNIRAGLIGEIGLGWPASPAEELSLRAAASAQAETGAALMIHPGMNVDAPEAHLNMAVETGADPTRIIMSHVERTLRRVDDMCRLADKGVYLNFDLFGRESSHHPFPYFQPNDGMRIEMIMELLSRGYQDHILISQDICHKSNL